MFSILKVLTSKVASAATILISAATILISAATILISFASVVSTCNHLVTFSKSY